MRILHVLKQLALNGTETYVMNLYREASKHGIIFDFLLYDDSRQGYYDEAVALGSKIYKLPSRKNVSKYYQELNNFFKHNANTYSAIHMCAGSLSSIAPLRYAKKYKIPIRIYHSHNASCRGIHNKLLHAINKRRLPKIATDFFACSKSAQEFAFSHTSDFSKSIVIDNGIDLDKYKYQENIRKEIRKELNIENRFVLGHIGRFVPEKNHKFLIDLFAEYHRQNTDAILLLIGQGPLEEEIRNQINKLGIQEAVKILGIRTDVNKILSALDLFLMPSIFEGFPFVLVEAQASGLPIIVSNNVSPEVKLIDSLEFKDLKDSTEDWLATIKRMKAQNSDRTLNREALKKYDARRSNQLVIELYQSNQ